MKKMTIIGITLFTVAIVFALNAKAATQTTGMAAETTVAATPLFANIKPTVGTWVDGMLSTIRDIDQDGQNFGGQLYLQLDYPLANDWKVGILNRVSFAYTDPINVQWAKLRLLAEKNGFVDTGSVSNKFTLRVEPRTTATTADKQIVDVITRYDFVFPIEGALSLKLREEPKFFFNELSNTELFYNGIEIGPVVALGPLFFNVNLVNWQRIGNDGTTRAGFGYTSYIEYAVTDNLYVDLWTDYSADYTKSAKFIDNMYWALDVYYTF
jgi:hypothetical protein